MKNQKESNSNLYFQLVVKRINAKTKYFKIEKISGKSLKHCISNLEMKLTAIAESKKIKIVKNFNKFEKRFIFVKFKENKHYSIEIKNFVQNF